MSWPITRAAGIWPPDWTSNERVGYAAILIPGAIDRDTTAVCCVCGGHAGSEEPTEDEDRAHGCGRPGCCCAAFVCSRCGQRYVAHREAPDCD